MPTENADPRKIIEMALSAMQPTIDQHKRENDQLLVDRAASNLSRFHNDDRDTAGPNDLGSGDDAYALGESVLEASFNNMLNKFMAESGGRVSVGSGRRTPERQQQLWDEALAKYGDPEIADNWVARPGTSNHERGTAADLRYADDAAREWAHQNAPRFGLTFPMGHEPWHIEPVKRKG